MYTNVVFVVIKMYTYANTTTINTQREYKTIIVSFTTGDNRSCAHDYYKSFEWVKQGSSY